jgi:hypothetical protein
LLGKVGSELNRVGTSYGIGSASILGSLWLVLCWKTIINKKAAVIGQVLSSLARFLQRL